MEAGIRRWTGGILGNVYELTGDLHGMIGWPALVEGVRSAVQTLPPEERDRAVIWASNYGLASALLVLDGPPRTLPPVIGNHMTYHLWGAGPGEPAVVVAVGADPEALRPYFEEVTPAGGVVRNPAFPNRVTPIHFARKPRRSLRNLWPELRDFG